MLKILVPAAAAAALLVSPALAASTTGVIATVNRTGHVLTLDDGMAFKIGGGAYADSLMPGEHVVVAYRGERTGLPLATSVQVEATGGSEFLEQTTPGQPPIDSQVFANTGIDIGL